MDLKNTFLISSSSKIIDRKMMDIHSKKIHNQNNIFEINSSIENKKINKYDKKTRYEAHTLLRYGLFIIHTNNPRVFPPVFLNIK